MQYRLHTGALENAAADGREKPWVTCEGKH
jgi:hypothetical protein